MKAHIEAAPSFRLFQNSSIVYHTWFGKAVALVKRRDLVKARMLQDKVSSLFLIFSYQKLAEIFTLLNEVITDIEFQPPAAGGGIFGPGAIYDFFKALRELLSSADHSLLIVDPYLDAGAFHKYVADLPQHLQVHLLAMGQKQGTPPLRYSPALKAAVDTFNASYGATIQLRQSSELHDRVVVLDDGMVWVAGQSIKDAAKTSTTYLAPLDGEMATLKREHYARIWETAFVD